MANSDLDNVKQALAEGKNDKMPPGTVINFGAREPIQFLAPRDAKQVEAGANVTIAPPAPGEPDAPVVIPPPAGNG